ncbi:B- and T-lymphocyte attenuator isoform X1 [Kryptolebias marmoratus]|uniref:B- and T-lymphocyte attenuator isoform X1 n=1 Tax=Kryptolebias marmoratus TaxID=37003 RepID=UPI0018ACEAE1|nr:B- and T-lymphocyte attenuator isoform X1 [Kryptolebias marmoratus]
MHVGGQEVVNFLNKVRPCKSVFEKLPEIKMLNLIEKLILCFIAFVCICGGEDPSSSCDLFVEVKRGTTHRVVPGQSLTVSCPLKHCGQPLNVTWCKIFNTTSCEQVLKLENVEIRQNYEKDELISFLSFKQVSMDNDGLYRCELMGNEPSVVGHSINISVSDLNHGADNADNKAAVVTAVSQGGVDDIDGTNYSWLPYFIICVTILLLVITLTTLTLLCFFGRKRTWTCSYARQEKISTQAIPNTPKTSARTSPALQTHLSVLNDIYCSNSAETTTTTSSVPSLPADNQPPVATTAAEGQAANSSVYAVINHQQSRTSSRKQSAIYEKVDDLQYAAVNLP